MLEMMRYLKKRIGAKLEHYYWDTWRLTQADTCRQVCYREAHIRIDLLMWPVEFYSHT